MDEGRSQASCSAGVVILFVGLGFALATFTIADLRPSGTRWNTIVSGVGLFLAFGSVYAWWQGMKHLRGALSRSPRCRPAEERRWHGRGLH
ncbi:MAG: hypothetical protein H0U67_03055 [Gemmatimonadetes bacterium]|nr:hypothetical protein [Gemmatimonadota bacterium]